MRCMRCGQESADGTPFCPYCGTPLAAPAAPGYFPAPVYTPPPPTSGSATTSLVMGILGLTVCPGLASIVAVITGSSAKREIEASGGTIGGSGLATAGLVMGWIGIGLTAISLCVTLVVVLLPLAFVPFSY